MTLETSHIGKGCDRDTYNLASQRQLCGASDLAIDLLPDPQQVRPIFSGLSVSWKLTHLSFCSRAASGRLAFNATKASPTTPVWPGSMGRRASVCPLRWCRPMPFLAINSLLRRGCDIVITRLWKSTSRNISFVKPMITVSITPVYLFHYFWVAVPIFQREPIVEFYYHLICTLFDLYQV